MFGLALLFIPLPSAVAFVRIITTLMFLYALLLFYQAWEKRAVIEPWH